MKTFHKQLPLSLLVIGVLIFGAGCDQISGLLSKGSQKTKMPEKKNVVLRVGDWSLSKEEFDQRMSAVKQVIPDLDINNSDVKEQALEELIQQQILVAAAEERGLREDQDIAAAIEEFERTLLFRAMMEKIVEKVTVSDAEIQSYFTENSDKLMRPQQWQVKEIVTATLAEAEDVRSQVLAGTISFEDAARQFSVSDSAASGGDVGFIQPPFFPALQEALGSLSVGEVSEAFEGPGGFYVVKVTDIVDPAPYSFNEIKEDLRGLLLQQKQQKAIFDYIEAQKGKIKIEKNNSLLE